MSSPPSSYGNPHPTMMTLLLVTKALTKLTSDGRLTAKQTQNNN